MAPSLVLPASESDEFALLAAIGQANTEGRTLLLEPGTHLTPPGRLRKIELGSKGLRIGAAPPGTSVAPAVIKRPNSSIDLTNADEHLGLAFVPARPTDAETAALEFGPAPNKPDEDFAILVRGDIRIDGLDVDCNMGNQGLNPSFEKKVSHCSMLRFAGHKYAVGGNRVVYVAFRSVTLANLRMLNGGYADDILIHRGYFNPNIQRVRIERIVAMNRVNKKRSTVAFAAQCANVVIRDVNIYRLEMEDTGNLTYRDMPRPNPTFVQSSWTMENITAERIDLAANGKVYKLRGKNLTTTIAFQLHQAAGSIADSNLTFGDAHRLNRLDNFTFTDVAWNLATVGATVKGIRPNSQHGDRCIVKFVRNTFNVVGTADVGQIINSELSADATKMNRVAATFTGCTYPDDFGRTAQRPIARINERGLWRFSKADLGDRDTEVSIIKRPDPDVIVKFI